MRIISLILIFLISFSAFSNDPRLPERSEFDKFASWKIGQALGQGKKKFGLGNWGAKGIVLYVPDIDFLESEELDYSSLFRGLDCVHTVGYEMTIDRQDAGPLAVALCEDDNTLLQKKSLKSPKIFKSGELARFTNNLELPDSTDNVYVFPVVLVGHGVFVALTTVTFSKNNNRVSVVQFMLDDWVCKENSSEDTALCQDLNNSAIELGSSLLEYED